MISVVIGSVRLQTGSLIARDNNFSKLSFLQLLWLLCVSVPTWLWSFSRRNMLSNWVHLYEKLFQFCTVTIYKFAQEGCNIIQSNAWHVPPGPHTYAWHHVQLLKGITLHLKSNIFWDITPCSPLKMNRRFGETSPPSSGSKNNPSKNPAWKQVASRLPENINFHNHRCENLKS
jgi:hypothetical protein